jgi:hypothetical protein
MAMPGMTMAQSKTVTSEMKVETGTVEAIDLATRAVTLKKADGTFVTTVAGPDIKRFAEVKVGDKITGRYYETIVVRVKQPGEPDVVTATKGTTGSAQDLPGDARARQLRITATIAGIDPNTPSITFTGPNGWKYTSRIQDTEALPQGEGRRQSRHRLDRNDTGVARSRPIVVVNRTGITRGRVM